MNINEIKSKYKRLSDDELNEFIEKHSNDNREGVKNIVDIAKKRLNALEKEIERINVMKKYEREYYKCGYVCGIDEVGRGPLAGPVVASAVILDPNINILYLNDSKQLSKKKRLELYDIIMEKAISVGVGIVSEQRIDEINILQANYEAMRMALSNLSVTPNVLLNDAVKIPLVNTLQVPIIKGDTLSVSIAAASIVAKVTRDRLMEMYHSIYPDYQFSTNMGYGSAKHIEALKTLGPCEIHRRTFIKNFV